MGRTVFNVLGLLAGLMLILRTPICLCVLADGSHLSGEHLHDHGDHQYGREISRSGNHITVRGHSSRGDSVRPPRHHSHGAYHHADSHHQSASTADASSEPGQEQCPCPEPCECAPQNYQPAVLLVADASDSAKPTFSGWLGEGSTLLRRPLLDSAGAGTRAMFSGSVMQAAICAGGNPCAFLARWLF